MKKFYLPVLLAVLFVNPAMAQEAFPLEYIVPFNPNIYTDFALAISHRTTNYVDFVPPVITEHYRLDNDIDLGGSPIDDIYISITPDKIAEWEPFKSLQIHFVSRLGNDIIRCTSFDIGEVDGCQSPVKSVFGMQDGMIKYVVVITKPKEGLGYRNYIFEIFPKPGGYYHIARLHTGDQWNVAATALDFKRRFPKAMEKLDGDKVMAYLKAIHESPDNFYRKDGMVYSEPYLDYIVYQGHTAKENLKNLFSDMTLFDGTFRFNVFGPMYYDREISKEYYAFKTMFFRKMNGHSQVCFVVPECMEQPEKKVYRLDCNPFPDDYRPLRVFSPFKRYRDGIFHLHDIGLIAGKQGGKPRLFIYEDYCGKWCCCVTENDKSEDNVPILMQTHSYEEFLHHKDSIYKVLYVRKENWYN